MLERFGKGHIVHMIPMVLGMTIWACDAGAVQPYKDTLFEPVAQGSALCGPASFYMVFNFLGAHQVFKEADLREHPEDMAVYAYKVTSRTAICKWINTWLSSGISWAQLKKAADRLHALGSSDVYFKTELNSTATAYNTVAGDSDREIRLDYIKTAYLDEDIPVMIHLGRNYYLKGHYLVLTGYDPVAGKVYYADPDGGTTGEVSKTSFIHNFWYVSPSNKAAYYRARWDGQWMGFYH